MDIVSLEEIRQQNQLRVLCVQYWINNKYGSLD